MSQIKISIAQQIEAVRLAESRQRQFCSGGSVKDLRRPAERDHDLVRLNAAARTLELVKDHQDAIRAFLQLSEEARQAVLLHGATMAQMCLQLASAEAVAKAGGPVR